MTAAALRRHTEIRVQHTIPVKAAHVTKKKSDGFFLSNMRALAPTVIKYLFRCCVPEIL